MSRFLGLCVQFSKYFPDLSHMMKPLREQLKNSRHYTFGALEQNEFGNIKQAITNSIQLEAYNPDKLTRVIHDACETGLAYMNQQEHVKAACVCPTPLPNCGCCWKPLLV